MPSSTFFALRVKSCSIADGQVSRGKRNRSSGLDPSAAVRLFDLDGQRRRVSDVFALLFLCKISRAPHRQAIAHPLPASHPASTSVGQCTPR